MIIIIKCLCSDCHSDNFPRSEFATCINKIHLLILVQGGDYIGSVLNRNNAENISRVLYPNDNVSFNFNFQKSQPLMLHCIGKVWIVF